MLAWFQANLPTILIIAVLILFFALLLYSLIKDKKKGKSSCCGGCAGCAMNCPGRTAAPSAKAESSTEPSSLPPQD